MSALSSAAQESLRDEDGLLVAARDADMRAAIGLDANARVLLVITEGATDPDRYRELVGLTPGDLAIAAK